MKFFKIALATSAIIGGFAGAQTALADQTSCVTGMPCSIPATPVASGINAVQVNLGAITAGNGIGGYFGDAGEILITKTGRSDSVGEVQYSGPGCVNNPDCGDINIQANVSGSEHVTLEGFSEGDQSGQLTSLEGSMDAAMASTIAVQQYGVNENGSQVLNGQQVLQLNVGAASSGKGQGYFIGDQGNILVTKHSQTGVEGILSRDGSVCSPVCATTDVLARAKAQEIVQVSAVALGNKAGEAVQLNNSTEAVAAMSFAIQNNTHVPGPQPPAGH